MEKVSPCWKHLLLQLCSRWPWCPHSPTSSWAFSCLIQHVNWKTFLFRAQWFPPWTSTPHHGWLFRHPHLSWPLNLEKIFFDWVVVMVKISIYLHILCEVTAPSVVFLPPFLPPRKAPSPVLNHCNFKVLFAHVCISFADHSNIAWWMFPSRFTGIYEKLLRNPFRS